MFKNQGEEEAKAIVGEGEESLEDEGSWEEVEDEDDEEEL